MLVVVHESEAGSHLTPVRAADPRDEARLEAARDPDEEEGGDQEAHRVERVDLVRPEKDDADARDHRPEEGREVLGALHEGVRRDRGVFPDEVRDRRVARRAEERGREARERGDGTDAGG